MMPSKWISVIIRENKPNFNDFKDKKMNRGSQERTLRRQNTILAAKNFLAEMNKDASSEELRFIADNVGEIALFWHLIENPEEISLLELQI
ncbi:MAG: hypothetical protein RMX96_01830 [Nostoc sp. ChiSLP02]|nr:hypothetical protein [Nostoc sp. DedSLP05]MDZ8098798.1 hypothetical protein [Nostoc sp. DedSLP01]MDZ8183588.1 hypothetical protein [Nostoc sp. ChiSLP02]